LLFYPLHQSLGHTKSSQSSLVVSWQRIYNSLAVLTAHIKSYFCRLTSLYSVVLLCVSLYSFNSHSHSSETLLSQFCTSTTTSFGTLLSYIHFARTPRKTACIVDKACSPRRCLATEILLFRTSASEGMFLATRCIAMGMARTTYKTILAILFLLLHACISGVAQKWVYMPQCVMIIQVRVGILELDTSISFTRH
jgi:hypothetical protein